MAHTDPATFFEGVVDSIGIYASTAAQFGFPMSSTLATDSYGRAMYLFNDTLNEYDISRVRMLHVDTVPSTAMQTALGSGILSRGTALTCFFADMNSPVTAYFPVACTVTDAQSNKHTKLFAVSDLKTNVGNPSLRSVVIGGVVGSCSCLTLEGVHTTNPSPTNPVAAFASIISKYGLGHLLQGTSANSTTSIDVTIAALGGIVSLGLNALLAA